MSEIKFVNILAKKVGLFNTSNTHINPATEDGNLAVIKNNIGLEIAKGNVSGVSFIHKFGNATTIQISDNFIDIWDGVENANANNSYTFSTTADITKISSSDVGDIVNIEIQGLDVDFNYVSQTKTLDGQNKVTLDTPLIRTFRMINRGSSDLTGDVYCYVDGTIAAGVPTTNADIRAIINNGNNQTLMAIYTIPNGKTGYMRSFYASFSKKQSAISVIELKAKPFNEVFQLKHIITIASTGTSEIQHMFEEPEIFSAKTDILLRGNTSANDSGIAAGFVIVLVDD